MSQAAESWRAVPGWEGLYEVSDLGRVRSLSRVVGGPHGDGTRTLRERFLRTPLDDERYPQVSLHRDGSQRSYRVHELMLAAFVGPAPFPRAHGRHLNDESSDNRIENLAWGTGQENAYDAIRNGRGLGRAKLEPVAVRCIAFLAARGVRGVLLARLYRVTPGSVSAIKRRITWRFLLEGATS